MTDAPERIVTRHYANGIIAAQPAEKGFSFNGGNHTMEGEYVRADAIEALQARVSRAEEGMTAAYMAGYERGKDAGRAKALEESAKIIVGLTHSIRLGDLLSTDDEESRVLSKIRDAAAAIRALIATTPKACEGESKDAGRNG